MAALVALKPTLSDSNMKTRPDFRTFLVTDANAGGDVVSQIQEKRRRRHMHFPCLTGRADVDSFQEKKDENPAFLKWNDEGDYRAPVPFRSFDNIVDPVSGFVSVGGDVDRNTGHTMIRSLVQLSDTPQSAGPKDRHSNRASEPAAPQQLRRANTSDNGAPSFWNSRKISDAAIRAQLGGWTSDEDPRKSMPQPLGLRRTKSMYNGKQTSDLSKSGRDRLALKYMYSSSTQRERAVAKTVARPPLKRTVVGSIILSGPSCGLGYFPFQPVVHNWFNKGCGWDWFQQRRGYYRNQPIVFCSANPRTPHIPGYSGCVGAENLEEIDNMQESFKPFTVKRVLLPRPTDTSHRPNIPCYTGCSLWQGEYNSNNSKHVATAVPSTADVHKTQPVTPNNSTFKRDSQMSKMVTLVPPCNPFNSMEKEPVVV